MQAYKAYKKLYILTDEDESVLHAIRLYAIKIVSKDSLRSTAHQITLKGYDERSSEKKYWIHSISENVVNHVL